MPLSAYSPEGPVTLVGVDPITVERMRDRNRKEKIYTAKCCGAPVQVRTSAGKVPHFVHLVTPTNCEGDKHITPEHRRLQNEIALAVKNTDWTFETEASLLDEKMKRRIWAADVLATKGKGQVAFEVQLSNADWPAMKERQERYLQHGVRGLWFVKTKKGFPATEELPVFVIESDDDEDWVRLSQRWDDPYMWSDEDCVEHIPLSEFVQGALSRKLKWAPYWQQKNTVLNASIHGHPTGNCEGCGRTVIEESAVSASIASNPEYPWYYHHWRMPRHKREKWFTPIVDKVWQTAAKSSDLTFESREGNCCWCGASIKKRNHMDFGTKYLPAQLSLGDLPKPAFGTVEYDWLRRWAFVE